MPDARGVDAWIRWEYDTLNAGFVVHPKSLAALLRDPTQVRTRDGLAYDFDTIVLARLASACTPEEQSRLRLPVTIHFSADVDDSAYVSDELAATVLHRLEGWAEAYPFRDGRMWIPHSAAMDLILRYGGALQRLML